MRIAWIEHYYTKETKEVMKKAFMREYGLELFDEVSWEKFEEKNGPINSYDGLLMHPGLENQKKYVERAVKLKIPVAIGTASSDDYLHGEIPVLSYYDKESIAKFFTERKNKLPI
jgi:hypothetical protein